MISFSLEEEERLLQETVHSFAEADIRPRYREAEKTGVPDAMRKKFNELGLSGLDLPTDLGGAGLSWVARALVLEELGWGDAGIAVDLASQAGILAVLSLGDAAQQKRLLAPLAAGKSLRTSVAFSEGKAATSGGFSTTARRDGDFFILDGEKAFAHGAASADFTVVFAQVEPGKGWDGIGAFVVDKGAAGAVASGDVATTGLCGVPKHTLKLTGVRVPAMNRLQGGNDFVGAAEMFFRRLGLKISAIAVGMARAAYEYALRYSEERVAFGKPIGHFQFIAFTLSDMAMAVDGARWMVWRAATELDQGRDGRAECAMAYSHALETAMYAGDWSVQILGGHGYICDHPAEKWMRDAKTLSLWAGSREFANAIVADAVLGASPPASDRLPVHDIQPVYT